MSSFVNGSLGLPVTIHIPTNIRHGDFFYFSGDDYLFPTAFIEVTYNSDDEIFDFSSPWWPNISGFGVGIEGLADSTPLSRQLVYPTWFAYGSNGRLAFSGITRDQYGSPLPNCTVRCIRNSTDELVSKVSSDANGAYIATTPYSDAHFLVIHNSDGTLAGATVNTALPA